MIQTRKASNRFYTVTAADDGVLLELGPAGTTGLVSTFTVNFNPALDWNGQFVVMGRPLGVASDNANTPFVPIPYRIVSLNNSAQDYSMVSAAISGAALIQVPANGLSIALLTACSVGKCDLTSWDLQGSSAI